MKDQYQCCTHRLPRWQCLSGYGSSLIRITRTSKHSVSNRFSPENEKQDCIAITIDGLDNDRIKQIEYFNLSRMVSGMYFADASSYHGSGYYLVDYRINQKVSEYLNHSVIYRFMESPQAIIDYTPSSQNNSANPLVELFFEINEYYTEKDILSFVGSKNLGFQIEYYSGTMDYNISYADDIIADNADKDSGNYISISMTRDGKLRDVTYFDLESVCLNGYTVHYYSPLFSQLYEKLGMEAGYYVNKIRYNSASDAIAHMLP